MKKINLLFIALSTPFAHSATSTIYQTDYTGLSAGNLQFQDGWLGQNLAQVDPTGTGIVTSVGGPFDRNVNGNGATGGTGGTPSVTGFTVGDSMSITFGYQFTLPDDGNTSMAAVGFRDGFGGAFGFNAVPVIGFDVEYNVFDSNPAVADDGGVKFFPDLNDSANSEALILDGLALGITPGALDGTVDLVSDNLEIFYEITNTAAGLWDVTGFSVTNLDTSSTFNYTGPTQTISYSGTDAFFAQQLVRDGDANHIGTSDGVTFTYTSVPEPSVLISTCSGLLLLCFRRRR